MTISKKELQQKSVLNKGQIVTNYYTSYDMNNIVNC